MRFSIIGLAIGLSLAGCRAGSGRPGYVLQYRFRDGGSYRVDCSYQMEKKLTKAFDRKIFSDHSDGLYTKFTFRLRTTLLPQGDLQAAYTLVRFRIHDQQGHFLCEAGPQGGSLKWYKDEQSLEAYLGPEDFRTYCRLLAQPLAVVRINGRGIQPDAGGNNFQFDYALLKLLGKNRVLGAYIVQSVKIPPVLMMIFDPGPVNPEHPWHYRSQTASGPVTDFTLKAFTPADAVIACRNQTRIKHENLEALGRTLGLEAGQAWKLKLGEMQLDGEVHFSLPAGRPSSGWMKFVKDYHLDVQREAWELSALEQYDFTVVPEP